MKSGHIAREKASALLGVFLFCFQLGGAYLLPSSAVSSSCRHTRIWLSSSAGRAGNGAAAAADSDSVVTAPAPPVDDGDSIWQCPGTANDIALTPPQPYRVAAASTAWRPEMVWINPSDPRLFLPPGYRPGPFQPPKSRPKRPF